MKVGKKLQGTLKESINFIELSDWTADVFCVGLAKIMTDGSHVLVVSTDEVLTRPMML